MLKQTTQMERQTDLMQNILDSLDSVSEAEPDTQSIEKETHTLQDIGRSVQEYTEFTKTLVYCVATGFVVWQLLCKTREHINKSV